MNRIPPNSLDHERAILGAVLLEGREALARTVGVLRSEDFYTEAHRVTHQAMLGLFERDEPIDLLTVQEALRKDDDLVMAGGPQALALLAEQGAIAAYLDAYVDIVVAKSKLRGLIGASAQMLQRAYEDETSPEEIIGATMTALEHLTRRSLRTEYDPAVNWKHVVDGWGVSTVEIGLSGVDGLTGGLARGQTLVNAGRTSQGKTAFTWDRTLAMAVQGRTVDLISLEENVDAATRRAVANLAGVSIKKLRDGSMHQGEFERAEEAVRQMQRLPIRVLDIKAIGSTEENAVVGAASLSRAEVVVIDHLQKIEPRPGAKGEPRTYAIGRMMHRLEAIGLRDGKVMWINVQLSRETDARKGPPMLSDIRDSSEIENTARIVFLLWWPWKMDDEKDPTAYELHVAKNSEGGTGRVPLTFKASVGRFENRQGER